MTFDEARAFLCARDKIEFHSGQHNDVEISWFKKGSEDESAGGCFSANGRGMVHIGENVWKGFAAASLRGCFKTQRREDVYDPF